MSRAKTKSQKVAAVEQDLSTPDREQHLYLETKFSDTGEMKRIPITELPFCVGRSADMELTLTSVSVSSCHAEINRSWTTGELHVRDLGSTNGTFVNRRRIQQSVIRHGDVLHFADAEYLFSCVDTVAPVEPQTQTTTTLQLGSNVDLPKNFVKGVIELVDLMKSGAVVPLFQPIVRLPGREVAAYEALARGRHPKLPESPKDLFQIAAGLGVEPELSRIFAQKALEAVVGRDFPTIFFNTHPKELDQDIIRFIPKLRKIAPDQKLVLEIHERAMRDAKSIRTLRDVLRDHDIGLAFDDFGSGESRLVQLAEVPPDYLKFDISFVRDIDKAPESKRHMLRTIVAAAHDLGVQTVAEGIETEAAAEVCTQIGFTHAQGFLFGQPQTADQAASD